jgi:electron transfer flavoprotein beta subunit
VRIVVGIKWVPNTQAVRFDPKTGTLIRAGVPSIVNPHDFPAVELALRLRDQYGGEVIALTMAPPGAIQGLEHVLGMGVDKAVLLTDRKFAGADTLATSYVIAKGIEKISREIGPVDLAVFGHETIDSSTAHIGAQVASWLGWPYIYYARDAKLVDGNKIRILRQTEKAIEEYDLKLPAVVATAIKALKPRPVRLSYKLRAKLEKPIITWTNDDLGLDPRCTGLKGSPTIVANITWMPEVPRKKIVYKPKDPRDAARWILKQLFRDEEVAPFLRKALWGEE